jgi:hypothetical protein
MARLAQEPPQAPPVIKLLDIPVIADFRKHLAGCEAKGWEHFDDVVFKIAAGGLALSVTLLSVARNVQPSSMPCIYMSWVLWSLTLLLLLVSVLTGQEGLRSQIAHLDAGDYYDHRRPEGRWGSLTPWLNRAAAGAAVLGICCVIVFALRNISGGTIVSTNDSGRRDLGQVFPQAPQNPAASVPQSTAGAGHERGQVAPQAPTPTTVSPIIQTGAGQVAPQAPPSTTPGKKP